MGATQGKCFNCFSSASAGEKLESRFVEDPLFEGMVSEVPDSKFHEEIATEPEEKNEDSNSFSKTQLLKAIEETQEKFFSFLDSDPFDSGFEEMIAKEDLKVYSKDSDLGLFTMSVWLVPYTPEEVVKFLRKTNIRKLWDKNIQETKKVTEVAQNVAVYYQVYKKVTLITQRDLLVVSKVDSRGDSWFDVCTSIESPVFPESKQFVRARTAMGGYFAEKIEPDADGNITKVISINQTDFGGGFPKAMIKNLTVKHIPLYVSTLKNAMKKYKEGKFDEVDSD